MEIKKYKKEILTKLVYNINDIINTFQNEKFFQYGNNLFITKLKFINKKKTQYKLILEIKNIYKNKTLYIWEWFIDENKNLETFNKFYLKIKALCENKEIDLVNEFENFFILYCPSFIKFHKVLETIILNEGTEVIEFNLAFRLFLMLILEKKEIDMNLFLVFKDIRTVNKISELNNKNKNNRKIELEKGFFLFETSLERYENTIEDIDDKLLVTQYFIINIAKIFKEHYKEKEINFLNILKEKIEKEIDEKEYTKLIKVKGVTNFDNILVYLKYCEDCKIKYKKEFLGQQIKEFEIRSQIFLPLALKHFLMKLPEIKDVRKVRKELENVIKKASKKSLKKLEVKEEEILEYLESIDNKALKKEYKKCKGE